MAPTPPAAVVQVRHGQLPAGEVAEVRALVDAATESDGVAPFSEHVLLHLPWGGDQGGGSLLVRHDGHLVGYAHLDVTDRVEGSSAELAVHPQARRQGVASALLQQLLQESPDGRLRLWAHGEHPGAAALAQRHGFHRSRVLWQMRRPLPGPDLPDARLPDGVIVRTFRPGHDEAAWLETNRRAFADHPDQGGWGPEELALREREPWFDPQGFFLAEREGHLAGFHWTKVHGRDGHAHPALGEVYVLGVDPKHQGGGLGPALTAIGLAYLAGLGLSSVMLYVDEANTTAIRVYEKLGFARYATDVCYSRRAPGGSTSGNPSVAVHPAFTSGAPRGR